ncbi:hypothetical protein DICPUDRAFT_149996 [Dictyostelium purpureum]|uniref:GH18 domain-containing protein n=1 Tax=Dictyostelium purpureum TaxID=5786 RepID=F0ZF68_DICPU|nr:uncharacterized protein DICPUDRAFT_149996 [Dictyostelium purpureum]EGC37422.1 hypothetical protein DICPUDRAFT_149996 [Dictyostelium purpureum]|eukprot:XP_003286075.1 hypothetical protein DICPUDRAFT_149996 [Dictyostelium purpureum]
MFTRKDLVQRDYDFNSEEELHKLSFTSSRVVNQLYNSYLPNEYKVTGFIQNTAQFDGRLNNTETWGEGFDLATVNPYAYDKLVFCYFGLVGDQGVKKHVIEKSANDLMMFDNKYTPVPNDSFGACQSFTNVGFEGWNDVALPEKYNQRQCQGLLGGLRMMKEKNPELKLEMAIGGWSFSQPFHHMVKTEGNRSMFIDGVKDILHRFPMFDSILIDWEYPCSHGDVNNEYSPEDCENYCKLIQELRMKLPQFYGDINVTLPATIDQLSKINAKNLMLNGASNIYLLTLDYFGGWCSELKHDSSLVCAQQAVDYLIGVNGVNPKSIHIGYRTGSKNAIDTEILSWSPLKGKFKATFNSKGNPKVVGTFESAVSTFNDIMYNYIDFESGKPMNGFKLHYDPVSKAEFLYNQKTKLFMSIETPKSVKSKAEFVREKGLGGLFNQSISADASGLLLNAARDGFGNKMQSTKINMEKCYNIQQN